jgi:hypothetical protein
LAAAGAGLEAGFAAFAAVFFSGTCFPYASGVVSPSAAGGFWAA